MLATVGDAAALHVAEHELWAEALARFTEEANQPDAREKRKRELEQDARDHKGQRRNAVAD